MVLTVVWTAAAAWALFASEAAALAASNATPRPTLRLMTYNIHAWRDAEHIDNFHRVVDAVNECAPDVLCMNEVLHPFVAPGGDSGQAYYNAVKQGKGRGLSLPPDHLPNDWNESYLARLAAETGLAEYSYGAATDVCYFGKVPFGNAILSRYPIRDCNHIPLEVEPGDLSLGNQRRDFVDPRLVTVANIVLPGDLFGGCNLGVCLTHLDQKSEQLREKQTLRVIDAVSSSVVGFGPHVVCGDLNSFRKSDTDDVGWKRICDLYDSKGWERPEEESLVLGALDSAGYSDAFYGAEDKSEAVHSERGYLPGPTCWANDPVMRIDHVWISPQRRGRNEFTVRPRRFSRILVHGSDHFPVFVDLELVSLTN